jgi:hypothetical protein
MSAKIPPTTVIGADAKAPEMKRKINRAGHVGAKAHARVKTVKPKNVESITILRPCISLSGLNNGGPKTYPIRKTEFGNASCSALDTLNSLDR